MSPVLDAKFRMKKRILFVDDDPNILEMYRLLFECDETTWRVLFANDLEASLRMMETAPCDVLVAKWRLPGGGGPDLFIEAAARHPQAARIVVSEEADREDVAKTLDGRHQFIVKPIDLNVLRSTIWRLCSMQDAALDARLESLLSADYCVPSLPSLYFRILRAMESPDASLTDVGEIISEDPAMMAKILQLVNSAFFGLARRISNPIEAVQILGLQKVRSLVLSVHVFSCFDQARMKSFPLSRLWSHSIATSQVAQKICRTERADKATTEEAVLACMLHDVGKVILASGDPDRYQSAVGLAHKRRAPLFEIEREVFGASHAEVGAFLLSQWGLPLSVIEAIALHHEPRRSGLSCFTPLTATHVATCLENEVSDPVIDTAPTSVDMEYLDRVGLGERLSVWREAVEEVEIFATAGTGKPQS